MSRIGLQPVAVPSEVTVKIDGNAVSVKGPKGEISRSFPPCVIVELKGTEAIIRRNGEDKFSRSMHGTARSLLTNMVKGVCQPFKRDLEIQGVGFKASIQGQKLNMALGFSHPIDYTVPAGVTVTVADSTKISVTGVDKQLVGQVSAQIRSYYKAEPYKGKGVRYSDEHVRRKAGKTVS